MKIINRLYPIMSIMYVVQDSTINDIIVYKKAASGKVSVRRDLRAAQQGGLHQGGGLCAGAPSRYLQVMPGSCRSGWGVTGEWRLPICL